MVKTNIKDLIESLKKLPIQVKQETTIFGIGARGHFENPTTDVLAFFCDVAGEHKLGNLVLSSLLESLDICSFKQQLCSKPEREVKTKNSKRIDLLLEAEDWVLALENKIGHIPVNPFDEYEQYVLVEQSVRFKGKEPIFVLLSPEGESPEGYDKWNGLSYERLLGVLKPQIANYFLSDPLNKWAIMLREFVLHLEEMLVKPKLLQENMEFVLENYQTIQKASLVKAEVFEQCNQALNDHLTAVFGENVNSNVVKWDVTNDAIRFALCKWSQKNKGNETDIALFMDENSTSGIAINLYILIEDDGQQQIVDKSIESLGCVKKWYEGKYACYKFEPFNDLKIDTLKYEIEAKIRLLDELETKLRT